MRRDFLMWMKVLDAHFAKKKPATLCELLGDLTIAARLQIDFSHRLGGSNPEQPDGNNGTEYSKTRYGPSRRISRAIGFRPVHHGIVPLGHRSLLLLNRSPPGA